MEGGSLLGLPSDRVRVIQHPASRSILGDLFVKLLGRYTEIQLLYRNSAPLQKPRLGF